MPLSQPSTSFPVGVKGIVGYKTTLLDGEEAILEDSFDPMGSLELLDHAGHKLRRGPLHDPSIVPHLHRAVQLKPMLGGKGLSIDAGGEVDGRLIQGDDFGRTSGLLGNGY
jgi:hypothetical protein